jgi:formate C-acetyltransferase
MVIMAHITLPDIRLQEYTLSTLDYLKELREQLLSTPVEICIERARYITRFMKTTPMDMKQEPLLYRAKAVSSYLSNKRPVFPDTNLLAGTTGSKLKTAPVYPEFIGITIWSELDTISKRQKNPQLLSAGDARELNLEIYPYWIDRDVLAATKKRHGNEDTAIRLLEKMIFYISGKAGCISHTVPMFEKVLREGMLSMIREAQQKAESAGGEARKFYEAVCVFLQGVLDYARNVSDEAARLAAGETDTNKKRRLLAQAEVCKNVPAQPAASFREAVNCIWLCLIGIHAENINMAISPGRLDQVLYPYYKKDVESGRLSIKEAMELIGCLWIKLGDNVDLVPQVSEELFGGAGTAPAVTVGGVDAQGEDAVNDLTYIMLRVTELLKLREPNMNARYHYEKNTKEYRNRVCEVIANTKAVPAFHNDVENIKTLQNQGVSPEHARDYAIIGCVELAVSGRSYDASSSIILNLSAPLELSLYGGRRYITGSEQFNTLTGDPTLCKSFDEFRTIFQTQAKWLIDQAIGLNEKMAKIHQEMLPTPLLSALFEGPLDKGKDLIFGGAVYNASGATHVGFADTVDSLNAIKTVVYDQKYCTFAELLEAIRSNFEKSSDQELLRQVLVNKALKYGTAAETERGESRTMIRFLYDTYQGYTNYRGGTYRPAYWTMTNHAGQGKITYALPNGRKANLPFASGITPVSGVTKNLTECLNSVASLGSLYIPGGEALNIKFTAINNEQDIQRFGDYIEAYFIKGGQQVQFNIMSSAMLKDAKAHPENYSDLLVRVSGYSAYFNDLNDAMKDELITRSEYDIEKNGEVVLHG